VGTVKLLHQGTDHRAAASHESVTSARGFSASFVPSGWPLTIRDALGGFVDRVRGLKKTLRVVSWPFRDRDLVPRERQVLSPAASLRSGNQRGKWTPRDSFRRSAEKVMR